MSIQDPIADMLTVIRNGLKARKQTVTTPYSSIKSKILDVLVDEGYLKNYTTHDVRKGVKAIEVTLKYYANEPIIHKITRISKPSLRKYFSSDSIPSVLDDRGISIVSTNQGVMTNFEARKSRLGGEVICQVE